MYAGFDPRDERCAPVYRLCQDRALPILFHTGTTFIRAAPLGFTRPWLFDEVAIAYPELRWSSPTSDIHSAKNVWS